MKCVHKQCWCYCLSKVYILHRITFYLIQACWISCYWLSCELLVGLQCTVVISKKTKRLQSTLTAQCLTRSFLNIKCTEIKQALNAQSESLEWIVLPLHYRLRTLNIIMLRMCWGIIQKKLVAILSHNTMIHSNTFFMHTSSTAPSDFPIGVFIVFNFF